MKATRCTVFGTMHVTHPAPPDDPAFGIRLGYSIGNLGKSVVLTVFDTFLLYYLVQIAGFSPISAGGLLFAVMLWDGCTDIAVAYLADRHGRANALHRLIVFGAPLCGASFWMIFALSLDRYGSICAAVVLCRSGFTLCDIGHNTLLVRIATTARAAANVSGMRLIFSAAGAGLVGLAMAAILTLPPGRQQPAFMQAAMIGGAIYVVTLMIAIGATRHLSAQATRRPTDAAAIVGGLWRNRMYRYVLCLIALQAGLVPLFGRALPFVGEAAHGNAGWAGTALTIITLCQASSLPLWMTLSRTRSPRFILAMAYGAMLAALGLLALYSGGATGVVGLALIGVAQAGMNMAIWAMLALSVRHGAGDGAGNEALPVGLFLAVLKSCTGLGNGLLAAAIAIGNRWCFGCTGDHGGLISLAAIVLPVLGCILALCLVIRMGHDRTGRSVAEPVNSHR